MFKISLSFILEDVKEKGAMQHKDISSYLIHQFFFSPSLSEGSQQVEMLPPGCNQVLSWELQQPHGCPLSDQMENSSPPINIYFSLLYLEREQWSVLIDYPLYMSI
uniref:Uncharacterized protein n=1 Tax=Nelumbo nucifera TaxID=4432 RepID=A0A822Y1R3_NELNU|nr:TPA_asm: hypothetical protein HUJ06_026670 [Nelumbo nucifera]